jgi:hypothetical protein
MSLVNPQTGLFVYIPGSQYLFKRGYAVSIGPPNQTAALQYGTIGAKPAPLRVRFEIEKTMFGASPNHSKIEIYNLSTLSRQNIKKGYLIQLQAGYNNLINTIFNGNVFLGKSERHGADIITSYECLDGGGSIVFARLDKSYPAGSTLVQVLQDAATAMSVSSNLNSQGIGAGIAVGIPNVVFNKGFVANGPCKNTLDKLLAPVGLEWTIDNNNLNVIPKQNYDGNSAVVVSAETGMIGVPSNNEFFTQFTSLINPKIYPGSLVQLVSENQALNGFYKVRKAKYEGDSHDNKWQVACECTPMPNVVQALPNSSGFDYNPAVVTA